MAACAREQVKLLEITPAEVKKLITGSGRAEKETVAQALKVLINFDRQDLPFDVADALAIALCYGMQLSPRWPQTTGPSLALRLKPSITRPASLE
jgi:crossover junction endodeoxyribonuclease RuvC